MQTVVLTGADSALGQRVAERLVPEHRVRPLDLGATDPATVDGLLDGADVLIHLGRSDGVELDGTGIGGVDVAGTKSMFDASARKGLPAMVVLSSATVYGAREKNPVPLTEDAPVRPNPGLGFATHKAEIERLAAEWRRRSPDSSVAVLRPTVAVAEDNADWLSSSLWSTTPLAAADEEPPAQFVHLDDLAEAVVLAARNRLDGPYNVAPDGWITGEDLRRLAGRGPSVRLSERLRSGLAAIGWKLGLASTPPALVAYRSHPWVVANDRLRAAGWTPALGNDEAFVASHRPSGWSTVPPRRRQEIALAATGVAALAAAVGIGIGIRRAMRR